MIQYTKLMRARTHFFYYDFVIFLLCTKPNAIALGHDNDSQLKKMWYAPISAMPPMMIVIAIAFAFFMMYLVVKINLVRCAKRVHTYFITIS